MLCPGLISGPGSNNARVDADHANRAIRVAEQDLWVCFLLDAFSLLQDVRGTGSNRGRETVSGRERNNARKQGKGVDDLIEKKQRRNKPFLVGEASRQNS